MCDLLTFVSLRSIFRPEVEFSAENYPFFLPFVARFPYNSLILFILFRVKF